MPLFLQIARKVSCYQTEEDAMLACLKTADPVKLTMAGKINLLNVFGKGQTTNTSESEFPMFVTLVNVSPTFPSNVVTAG